MLHPDIMQSMAEARLDSLRRSAADWRRHAPTRLGVIESSDVELRLCRVGDDPDLERLAKLDGRPLPSGRLIVAVVGRRIVAALPLNGGAPVADPFARTEHLLPLLELRAAQIRGPVRRRWRLGFRAVRFAR
jgi:hypothetical protein